MKKFGLLTVALVATWVSVPSFADCYAPKLARDAVRAIALISDRAMITDLVGGCAESCDVWANYRGLGYADRYEVVVDEAACRVVSLRPRGAHLPVQAGG